MKKFVFSILLLLVYGLNASSASLPNTEKNERLIIDSNQGAIKTDIADAFANHKSNVQVSGEGIVVRLLPDDTTGSRHQKFILKISSGQTVLVAHNIDLAPKIDALREGDSLQFSGEYVWNGKGGTIHWTHRDPNGSHVSGWLKHRGRIYQ